jgi:hypothetical protein
MNVEPTASSDGGWNNTTTSQGVTFGESDYGLPYCPANAVGGGGVFSGWKSSFPPV